MVPISIAKFDFATRHWATAAQFPLGKLCLALAPAPQKKSLVARPLFVLSLFAAVFLQLLLVQFLQYVPLLPRLPISVELFAQPDLCLLQLLYKSIALLPQSGFFLDHELQLNSGRAAGQLLIFL